jgi:uncharacterized protein YunC (DUF1805 family)
MKALARRLFRIGPLEIALLDSIEHVTEDDAGRIVITGAHGGWASAAAALGVPAALYVFNDAGLGKDAAGIVALKLLNDAGTPAVTVQHSSARIGEAEDTLASGVISQCNRAAHGLGLRAGMSVQDALHGLTE